MRPKRVHEIMIPFQAGTPLEPCVALSDKLIDAVRIMVTSNVESVAVVQRSRPVGLIRLGDALDKLGLQGRRA